MNQPCDSLDLWAYAEQRLSSEEREAVHKHLENCSLCRAQLQDLQDGFEAISHAMTPLQPPPSLRQQVLGAAFESPATNRESKPTQPFRFPLRRSSIAIAAMALFSAGLLAQVVRDQHQLSLLQHQLARAVPTAVSLQATKYTPKATGQVVLTRQGNSVHLVLVAANLKPTQGSQVYHIWLWNQNHRSSAGVMTVSSQGTGWFETTLSGPAATFNAIGITLEPTAKTEVPVGPKVLSAAKL
ncbi:anti-sigma factor [Alicyclobacillus tolerans]|uniref:anti-sigma factor n=1 Tax=Alicyclobacillus tolerans TaxID=90970 RepID=UPI001F3971A7|nr:anti-sigma factor [Alicyclobacillus tolerans]MCF8568440.1 anti-sigma factor [Alicyclobacillus tolerans]